MSENVRKARNVVVGMGVFMLAGGVFMLVTGPARYDDWLTQFAGAALCWGIVRQVNSGQGEWRKDVRTRPDRDEPAP